MLLALLVIVGYFLMFASVLVAVTAGALTIVPVPLPPR